MPVVIDQVEVVPESARSVAETASTTDSVAGSQGPRPEVVAAWLHRARERDLRRSAR